VSAKIVAKFTLDCQVSLQSATGTPSSQKSHDFAVQEPFAAQELRTSGAGPGASIAMRCRGGWAGGGGAKVVFEDARRAVGQGGGGGLVSRG
jgi:hypothetical protein